MRKLAFIFVGVLLAGLAIAPALPDPRATGLGSSRCAVGVGETNSAVVPSPCPVPTTAPAAPLRTSSIMYAYQQATTSCGGGFQVPKQAAQDLFDYVAGCQSDTVGLPINKTNCPQGSKCDWGLYFAPTQVGCVTTFDTSYAQTLAASPGPNDEGFTHATPGPATSANRASSTPSHCTLAGNAGGTLYLYPNIGKTEPRAWINTNLFTNPSYLNGNGSAGFIFFDNFSFRPIVCTLEYNTSSNCWSVSLFRAAQASLSSAFSGREVPNWGGPGSLNYAHNNATYEGSTNSIGIKDWHIDTEDYCNNLTTNGKAQTLGLVFEKLVGTQTTEGGVNSIYVFGHNVKIGINSAARYWHNANCTSNLLITGIMGVGGATSLEARMVSTFMRVAMEPNNYDGLQGTKGVGLGPRFPSLVTTLNQVPYYPEDGLLFITPITQIGDWVFDTSLGTGDNHGNGCDSLSTGGVNDISQQCGSLGVDGDGQTAPLYFREVTDCKHYLAGVLTDEGHCAVWLNPSTTTDITLSSVTKVNSYSRAVTPTGGELFDDPVTPGNHLANSSANATGAWATTSITGSYVLKHCPVLANSGIQSVWSDLSSLGTACVNAGILLQ